MSLRDSNAIYAGFQSILLGVDSGRSPAVLAPEQLAWAVNATTRGGFIQCRPGWQQRTLNFLNQDNETDATVEADFTTNGRFQRAHSYINVATQQASIVAAIGGHIFSIDLTSFNVQDLTSQAGFTLDSSAPLGWFLQAEEFLLFNNASDKLTIYDGGTLRPSKIYTQGGNELPGGSVMAYNNGRVWMANAEGTAFVAGDQVYSDGTTAALLKITENQYLTGGGSFTSRGSFASPAGIGPIKAMTSLAVQDSVTGHGYLQVFGPRGAFSINGALTREEWQTATNPVQTVSLLGGGAVSQTATVLVNGDAWYRSLDGVRSFAVARRDHGTWVNTPLSREVSRALDYDTPQLLEHGSGVLFDNRLLLTTQPVMQTTDAGVQRGVVHRGLISLDFAPVSNMLNRAQPVWEGVWTGLNILQILTVETATSTRCFLFTLSSTNTIELWELSTRDRFDSHDKRIVWSLETPAYGFPDGGWSLKHLAYSDLWLDRLAGNVDFTVKWQPDSYPFWITWHTWEECARYRACTSGDCSFEQLQEQFRTRIRLPEPAQACDEVTAKPHNDAYRFAARIEVEGFARLRQFRIVARNLPEDTTGGCP